MRTMRTRGSDNHQLAPEGPGGRDLASNGDTRAVIASSPIKKLCTSVCSGRAQAGYDFVP